MTARSIKRLRKRLGISQADLARKLGVNRSAVSRYEAGLQKPSCCVRLHLERMAGRAA